MAPETVVTVEHNKPTAPPQQQQGGALDWIKINTDYFKTPPGILKVIELILGILCMALSSPWYSTWFVFVAVTCFITTLLWSFVYFLSIREALKIPINWVLSELISTSIQTVFYLIAFIVLFAATASYYAHGYGANVAAAVFGIFNTLAYGASSFLLFKEHKSTVSVAAWTTAPFKREWRWPASSVISTRVPSMTCTVLSYCCVYVNVDKFIWQFKFSKSSARGTVKSLQYLSR